MNAELKTFVNSLGLEYSATFVPQSASRNSAEKNRSLNWRVSIRSQRGAGTTIATDYMQGIGHIPKDPQVTAHHKGARRDCIMIDEYERQCAETGKYGMGNHKTIPAPALLEVLYGLVLDSDADEYSFEAWADNLGYDTDSRKAESVYNACREIGQKLRLMLGAENLAKLRELFQDY